MKNYLLSIVALTVGLTSCTGSEEPTAQNFETDIELAEIRTWEINRPDIIPFPFITGFLHDESLLVVDRSLNTINHFDSAGNLIRTFGGRGNGPGEVAYVMGATIHPDGRIAVPDNLGSRVIMFNAYNESVVTSLLEYAAGFTVFLTNRELIVKIPQIGPDEGVEMMFYNNETKQPEQFNQLDLVQSDPPPEQVAAKFGKFWFLDDRSFISTLNSPDYLLYRVDPETNEPLTVYSRPEVPPVEYSETEQQEWIDFARRSRPAMLGSAPADLEAPRYKNRFVDFFVDHQERLWALMTPAEGELPYFDIFSSDGEYIGSMDLPEGAESIQHFHGNRILLSYPHDNPDVLKVGLFEIGD